MNICIVAGARPNFIKVAPIVRAVENAKAHGRDVDYTLVYAGSKDDPTLEASLFDDLQIAPPQVYLNVVCENLNELTGQVIRREWTQVPRSYGACHLEESRSPLSARLCRL